MSHLPHDHGNRENLQQQLRRTEDFRSLAEIFSQLGDGTRMRIFWLLCHCEECVLNIGAMMEMSSPAVSHHLRILKQSGLIVSRRVGKEVFYKAAQTPTAQMLHRMTEEAMEIHCPRVESGK